MNSFGTCAASGAAVQAASFAAAPIAQAQEVIKLGHSTSLTGAASIRAMVRSTCANPLPKESAKVAAQP